MQRPATAGETPNDHHDLHPRGRVVAAAKAIAAPTPAVTGQDADREAQRLRLPRSRRGGQSRRLGGILPGGCRPGSAYPVRRHQAATRLNQHRYPTAERAVQVNARNSLRGYEALVMATPADVPFKEVCAECSRMENAFAETVNGYSDEIEDQQDGRELSMTASGWPCAIYQAIYGTDEGPAYGGRPPQGQRTPGHPLAAVPAGDPAGAHRLDAAEHGPGRLHLRPAQGVLPGHTLPYCRSNLLTS